MEKEQERKYKITMTESQMKLMADAVEDWTRFLCGQCDLWNATIMLDKHKEIGDILKKEVRPNVVPDLPPNASYGWSGGHCPNEDQRKAIAMGYGIYRQVRHYIATHRENNSWDVYNSPTLTCPEQGPLITIEEIKQ